MFLMSIGNFQGSNHTPSQLLGPQSENSSWGVYGMCPPEGT